MANSFFDLHPEFYETSLTGTKDKSGQDTARLANRYEAIFTKCGDIYSGARILDLASHDGRWTLAAIHCGGAFVEGIEARPELVQQSEKTFNAKSVARTSYRFVVGDLVSHMATSMPGQFDVILCLGIFYHTLHHLNFFEQFERLAPKHVVIDTAIVQGPGAMIRFREEDHTRESATIASHEGKVNSLVGIPNEAMILLLAKFFGFHVREIEWDKSWVRDWNGCQDYLNGRRKTLLLSRIG